MGADVVTSTRFGLSKERMDELKCSGLEVRATERGSVKLAEPHPGEVVVGKLEGEEVELFYTLHDVTENIGQQNRNLIGEMMKRIGENLQGDAHDGVVIEGSMVGFDPSKIDLASIATDEMRNEYARLKQLRIHLHGMFHWTLGERLKQHANRLGVRAGLKIVVVAPRE